MKSNILVKNLFKTFSLNRKNKNILLLRISRQGFANEFDIDISEEEEMEYLEKDDTPAYTMAQIIKNKSGIEIPENYKEKLLSKMLPSQ